MKKEEQEEETFILLKQQFTTFLEPHKVLQEHFEESTTIEEMLRNWYTYYGQVFKQLHETWENIRTLDNK